MGLVGRIIPSPIRRAAWARRPPPSTSPRAWPPGTPALLVDMDPQRQRGPRCWASKQDKLHGTIDALLNGRPMKELFHPTELRYLQVAPAPPTSPAPKSSSSARRTASSASAMPAPARLRVRLHHHRLPALARPALPSTLSAADSILIPLRSAKVLRAREPLPTHPHHRPGETGPQPDLKMEGILLTMFDAREHRPGSSRKCAATSRTRSSGRRPAQRAPVSARPSASPSSSMTSSRRAASYLALGRGADEARHPQVPRRRVALSSSANPSGFARFSVAHARRETSRRWSHVLVKADEPLARTLRAHP